MGNAALTCMWQAPTISGSGGESTTSAATKVIHADGTVTRLPRPVRAAELMRAHPGQFVCDSARLSVGCRVPGVAADELLRPRHAYFLLPMDMLYSVLTDDEMAALSHSHAHAATAAASSAWRRIVTTATRGRVDHHRAGTVDTPPPKDSGGEGGACRVFPMLALLEAADLGAGGKPDRVVAAGSKTTRAATGLIRRHRSWQPALDTIEEVP